MKEQVFLDFLENKISVEFLADAQWSYNYKNFSFGGWYIKLR